MNFPLGRRLLIKAPYPKGEQWTVVTRPLSVIAEWKLNRRREISKHTERYGYIDFHDYNGPALSLSGIGKGRMCERILILKSLTGSFPTFRGERVSVEQVCRDEHVTLPNGDSNRLVSAKGCGRAEGFGGAL